jgi:hypothetical protein
MEIKSCGYFDKDWGKDRLLSIDLEDYDMITKIIALDIKTK